MQRYCKVLQKYITKGVSQRVYHSIIAPLPSILKAIFTNKVPFESLESPLFNYVHYLGLHDE